MKRKQIFGVLWKGKSSKNNVVIFGIPPCTEGKQTINEQESIDNVRLIGSEKKDYNIEKNQ